MRGPQEPVEDEGPVHQLKQKHRIIDTGLI